MSDDVVAAEALAIPVGSKWRYEGSDGCWHVIWVEKELRDGRFVMRAGYYVTTWRRHWFRGKERLVSDGSCD